MNNERNYEEQIQRAQQASQTNQNIMDTYYHVMENAIEDKIVYQTQLDNLEQEINNIQNMDLADYQKDIALKPRYAKLEELEAKLNNINDRLKSMKDRYDFSEHEMIRNDRVADSLAKSQEVAIKNRQATQQKREEIDNEYKLVSPFTKLSLVYQFVQENPDSEVAECVARGENINDIYDRFYIEINKKIKHREIYDKNLKNNSDNKSDNFEDKKESVEETQQVDFQNLSIEEIMNLSDDEKGIALKAKSFKSLDFASIFNSIKDQKLKESILLDYYKNNFAEIDGKFLENLCQSIEDNDFKKIFIDNIEKDRLSVNFISHMVSVCNTIADDDKYKKDFINHLVTNYSSVEFDIMNVLRNMNDESKKEVIDNAGKYGLNDYIYTICEMIKSDSIKKDIIDNAEMYGLDKDDIEELVATIQDENIKNEIKDSINSKQPDVANTQVIDAVQSANVSTIDFGHQKNNDDTNVLFKDVTPEQLASENLADNKGETDPQLKETTPEKVYTEPVIIENATRPSSVTLEPVSEEPRIIDIGDVTSNNDVEVTYDNAEYTLLDKMNNAVDYADQHFLPEARAKVASIYEKAHDTFRKLVDTKGGRAVAAVMAIGGAAAILPTTAPIGLTALGAAAFITGGTAHAAHKADQYVNKGNNR